MKKASVFFSPPDDFQSFKSPGQETNDVSVFFMKAGWSPVAYVAIRSPWSGIGCILKMKLRPGPLKFPWLEEKRSACVADRFFCIYRTKKGIAKVVVLTICNTSFLILLDFIL